MATKSTKNSFIWTIWSKVGHLPWIKVVFVLNLRLICLIYSSHSITIYYKCSKTTLIISCKIVLQINEDFPSAGDAGELRPPRLLLNLTIRDYPTYVIIQNYRFQVTFQLSSPPSQPTPFAE